MHVVYEDEQLLAVNKPAGQPVIHAPGTADAETLVAAASAYLHAKAFVVHRLDRETSGLVLFAKTAGAHRDLSLQFEHHQVQKLYLALVLGQVTAAGVVDQPLREFGSGRLGVAPGGKPARTAYRVAAHFATCTLLEVQPETGRRHQIRVHLYASGHPVLGDPTYGAERPVGDAPRLLLHALELEFRQPAGGPAVRLRAEPGADWHAALAATTANGPRAD